MAELGSAVLTIRVDSEGAKQQINAFRTQVVAQLGQVGKSTEDIFAGLETFARQAGAKAGNALSQSFKQATSSIKSEASKLKFTTGLEALNFEPRNTVRGLKEYADALRRLFDTTEIGSQGAKLLADRIGAVESAIGRARQTTAQATETQRQFNAALDKAQSLRAKQQGVQAPEAGVGVSQTRSGAAPTTVTQEAIRATNALQLLQEQLTRLQNYPINIDAKSLVALSDEARIAKKEVSDFVRGVINGETPLATNIAGLQQQARAFTVLAANAKATGTSIAEFTNYTQAAAKALQRELFTGFNQIDALRKLFALGNLGGVDSFKGTDELLAFGNKFKATPGAISLYVKALEEAQNVTDIADNSFNRLTSEILAQKEALDAAIQSAQAYARLMKLTPEGRTAVADKLTKAAEVSPTLALPSSAMLAQRVTGTSQFPLQRLNTEEINRYQGAIVSLSGAFGVINTAEENFNVSTEDARRRLDNATQGALNYNEALESLGLTESQYAQRVRNTSAALQDLQNVRNAVAQKALSDLQQADRDRVQGQKDTLEQDLAFYQEQRKQRQQELRDVQLDDLARVRQERQSQGITFDPAVLRRRQEQAAADRARRFSDARSSALIGGAFPLLFGQGLGASIGGGLGGFAGGFQGGQLGFGLSLVGTAVGAQIDEASKKLQLLGSALTDPIGKFGELQQAGALSSKGLERQVQALIDTGRQAEAAALIQHDLATSYGDLKSAQELARQSDELSRTWTQLGVTIASFTAGPLSRLIETLNSALGGAPRSATPGEPPRIGFNSFRKQVDQIAIEYGRDAARRVIVDMNNIRFKSGKRVSYRNDEEAYAQALKNARAQGLITKEQQAFEQQERKNIKARSESLYIGRQLITAEAQNNTTLTTGLKLRQSQVQEAMALASITEKDPKARQIRIEEIKRAAQQERDQSREQAKASFDTSNRNYKQQQQLVGVYGTQRQIKEEELKLVEARRVADQAQAAYNKSAVKDAAQVNALNDAILKRRITELQVTENIRRLEAERWANAVAAANQIRSIQDQTAIQQQRPNFTGTGIGALQSIASLVEARRAQQNALARLGTEPGNEQLQQAAEAAGKEVERAAKQTRSDLIEAYTAAKDSAQAIRRSIQDGVLALAQLQNTSGQGVNKYLNAQQVQQRQEQLNPVLMQKAQDAINQYKARTGQDVSLSVSGTLEQRNAQFIDIARVFDNENRAVEDLVQQNISLTKATNDLTLVNGLLKEANIKVSETMPKLVESLDKLFGKDWNVNVSVDSQGGVRAFGDVLTGAVS